MARLEDILHSLRGSSAVQDKIDIRQAFSPALGTIANGIAIGDDCAALPDDDGGHLLFAAEGLLESFVDDDPWFAGYSAIMVNVSDIYAMGGRPKAVVDVIWAPDYESTGPIWEGMTAAAADYDVPIVGGHTTVTRNGAGVHLAAAIVGRATRLMTSFDAAPGDQLLMAVDLNGSYRGSKPFWNATDATPAAQRRAQHELLPQIAERGWCKAAKDISNGGLLGTLIMLLECSGVGAELRLDRVPRPPDTDLDKWLLSFPSFGYLLSVAPENAAAARDLFVANGIACAQIGDITSSDSLDCILDGQRQSFWQQARRT